MRKFRVTYHMEGQRIVDVYLPEDKQLPDMWERMNMGQRDEWLYDNAKHTVTIGEDIDYGVVSALYEVTDWLESA